MSKRINKSEAHASKLIECAQQAQAAFELMRDAIADDQSAHESERAADLALANRKISECERMISWWMQDIANLRESNQRKSKREQASA